MNDIQTYFKAFETTHNVIVPEDLKRFYSITSSMYGNAFTFKIVHDKLVNCYFYPAIANRHFSKFYHPELETDALLISLINDNYKRDLLNLFLIVGFDLNLQQYLAIRFEHGAASGYYLIGKTTNENPLLLFDQLSNQYEVDNEYAFEKNALLTMTLSQQNHPLTQDMGESFLVFPKKMEPLVKRYFDILKEKEFYLIYTPLIYEKEFAMIVTSLNYLLDGMVQITGFRYDEASQSFVLSCRKSGVEKDETFTFEAQNENAAEHIYSSISHLLKTHGLVEKNIILILDRMFDDGQLALAYTDDATATQIRAEKTAFVWDAASSQYH